MSQRVIHIYLGEDAESTQSAPALAADAFAQHAVVAEGDASTEQAQFVVGVDDTGTIRRCVSQTPLERHIVGALVGSWVAQGLRVQSLETPAALIKVLRKSAKVAGVESGQAGGEPQPAPSGGEPQTVLAQAGESSAQPLNASPA